MASTITRVQTITDRVITVVISLTAKDGGDDALIKKFGDIIITPSGDFYDQHDSSYPKFRVIAGDPVAFFSIGQVQAVFADDTLNITDLEKRAGLWGDLIQLSIQNELTALRALTDTVTATTTVTI